MLNKNTLTIHLLSTTLLLSQPAMSMEGPMDPPSVSLYKGAQNMFNIYSLPVVFSFKVDLLKPLLKGAQSCSSSPHFPSILVGVSAATIIGYLYYNNTDSDKVKRLPSTAALDLQREEGHNLPVLQNLAPGVSVIASAPIQENPVPTIREARRGLLSSMLFTHKPRLYFCLDIFQDERFSFGRSAPILWEIEAPISSSSQTELRSVEPLATVGSSNTSSLQPIQSSETLALAISGLREGMEKFLHQNQENITSLLLQRAVDKEIISKLMARVEKTEEKLGELQQAELLADTQRQVEELKKALEGARIDHQLALSDAQRQAEELQKALDGTRLSHNGTLIKIREGIGQMRAGFAQQMQELMNRLAEATRQRDEIGQQNLAALERERVALERLENVQKLVEQYRQQEEKATAELAEVTSRRITAAAVQLDRARQMLPQKPKQENKPPVQPLAEKIATDNTRGEADMGVE